MSRRSAEYRAEGKVHTKRKNRMIRQGPNPRSRDLPPEVIHPKPPVVPRFKRAGKPRKPLKK